MKGLAFYRVSSCTQLLLKASPATSRPARLLHQLVQQQQQQQQQLQQHQRRTACGLACGTAMCPGKCSKSSRRQLDAAKGLNPASHKHTRSFALAQEAAPEVKLNDSAQVLELTLPQGGAAIKIPYMWLRDHCRSERCFNHSTQQKIPDLQLLERDLTPEAVQADTQGLSIKWRDGHQTEFAFDWLAENFYPGQFARRTRRTMWDRKKMETEPLPAVTFEQHMTSEEGLRQSLRNLVKYGFTMVTQAPPTPEGTRQASERVSPIQESMYGGLWTVSPAMGNNDTAYTHESLGAHTDNTYLTSPAGIEVFHLLEHDGTGGETLLVDGFNAVDTVRREDPEAYRTLRDTPIPFEYTATAADGKPPYHMKAYSPIFTEHPGTGELLTFRFNAYDRGNMDTVAPERLPQFYAAYQRVSQVIASPASQFWYKLSPGTVLLVDNWRVMHGRSAFSGFRLLSGCYLSRDEWISQARMFEVL